MTFKRTKEDFVCENCKHQNIGNGFTDHCEKCLWSKHVDMDPGDRAEGCRGMMKPIETRLVGKELRVRNKCVACRFERWAPILSNDDSDTALALS